MPTRSKNRFFAKHAKSSAALVSLGIHAVLILVALSFVAVTVINKEDQVFEAKPVSRPRMQLKKLQVPVNIKKKKTQQPKLRKRVVAKTKLKTVDIKMPEITGVKGGMGNQEGTGLNLDFSLDMDSLFGGDKSFGNDFIGTFYDLKQSDDGKPVKMNDGEYINVLANFTSSWNENRLERYFKAPKNKFATTFMLPRMSANAAPEAYGVADSVAPKHWAAYYRGEISAPETGRYRFCGYGDDILVVRVNNRIVIDACHEKWKGRVTKWDGDDDNNRRFPISGGQTMVIGDWFNLTKGKSVEMEVLFGECPGGQFACQLMIEQDGVEYRRVPFEDTTRPVLPVFKTVDIPEKLIPEMKLNPNVATADGPAFGTLK